MLDLKGGLCVCKKSQKISTASDQYFWSYVKKNYTGGQIDPPPAGIGLKISKLESYISLNDSLDLSLVSSNLLNRGPGIITH